MIAIKAYYLLKPFIPRSAQLFLRRRRIQNRLPRFKEIWPVDERSSSEPFAWSGWPEGKRFTLVLTHDVEHTKGQERCGDVMDLEMELGFRSSFNFVPERYAVSQSLRRELIARGFEVGVHDLNHDGKLFRSEQIFRARAQRINHYLRDWGAVGFRAGAMHHNLEWIGNLEIEYDASTFDTDPFEPQPDGVCTIFPFWVPSALQPGGGYVELPYTLPQDFTALVLMRDRSSAIWKEKLDWIARKGGMALLNTHPDYMHFGKNPMGQEEYSSSVYAEFLHYVKDHYSDVCWPVLPRVLARYWRETYVAKTRTGGHSIGSRTARRA